MPSSDEEDSQKIREALDPEFMNDSLFASKSSRKKKAHDARQPQSLRPKRNDDDQFDSLGVTPQFQNYVANALSSILDKKLEKRLVSVNTELVKKKERNRIKLLNNSEKCLKVCKEKRRGRMRTTCESDNDDDYQLKIVEAAVNPIDVINQTDVKGWSTKTKGKVFHYRPSTNGILTLID